MLMCLRSLNGHFVLVFHKLCGFGKLDEFHRLYYTSQYNGTFKIFYFLLHQWKTILD